MKINKFKSFLLASLMLLGVSQLQAQSTEDFSCQREYELGIHKGYDKGLELGMKNGYERGEKIH
ncbi:hypothetical protein LS70_002295 [Helicobacter sp. MIT 11-5569]|uniref:hypothetical protein n=1 Tax=Helicobacter sp. MIT 11-5569 TaxID=1548151 RepID=UPI00051FD7C9|nr:hypothetical protein [Helicobacter sp. MIT 11-5569]TLD84400.1 hypothetical protein LS70_002295 [Helicobacter sp. MIT 11-5569]